MQLLKLPDVFLSPRVPVEVVGASSPGQGTWEPCGTAPTHILFGDVLLNVPVQDSLLFSAAIPALFSYSMEPERPCVPLLPAAHLFQASERIVPSQAVIPKPKLSFPVARFSRSGLWSCFCNPRWSRGCCPHHLLLFLSSAVVKVISPCAPHTGPTLSADPQSTSSAGLRLHPAHPVLGLKHLHPLGAP